jgi:hypothetical protein
MDRKSACLETASACRKEAARGSTRRDQWLKEAEKWVALSSERTGKVAITYETRNVGLARESEPVK